MLVLKVVVSILVVWLFTRLSAEQQSTKIWQYFKILVETAVWIFLLQSWPEARMAIISPFGLPKIIGILYVVVCLGMLGILLTDLVQLKKKSTQHIALDVGVKNWAIGIERGKGTWEKNRKILMGKVHQKWIEGVLQNSLHKHVQNALGWDEMPVIADMEWRQGVQPTETLPSDTPLLKRFDQLEPARSLLVLGAAGAGKTVLLLKLAQDLLERTQSTDVTTPLPIVLNLSSWRTQGLSDRTNLTFIAWLQEALWHQYQIRRDASFSELKQRQWILLLDGLDEVAEQYRDTCVEALNQFRQTFGNIDVVLCCRTAEYEALNTPLDELQVIIRIQPLSEAQVHHYLHHGGELLAGILSAWQKDPSLRTLTFTPLYLGLLTLAYRNHSAEGLMNVPEDQRLRILFDRYIQQMFLQGSVSQTKQQQMQRWLSRIAQGIGSEKEFLIEQMKANVWLLTVRDQWAYRLSLGVLVGLIGGLSIKPIGWLIFMLLYWGVLGSLGAVFYGIVLLMIAIVAGEFLKWLFIGLLAGIVLVVTIWLLAKYYAQLNRRINASILHDSYPNQEIWYRFRVLLMNCIKHFFVTTSLSGFLLIAFFPLLEDLAFRSMLESVIGLVFILLVLRGEGLVCIQHVALRLALALTQQVPLDLVMLFKQAEDRLFIYRIGGSYVFIHRYLQEHFANLSFDET
ncbi:NACHT domain-containing protein [Acaryochloris marina NIES-2412]|uniref:NACHT domain-containing protein n=1 Tax=Acaryochloris marina TaxID=155978 RepID=UPI004059D71A